MLKAAKILNQVNFVFLIIMLVSCAIGLFASSAMTPIIISIMEEGGEAVPQGFAAALGGVLIVTYLMLVAICVIGIIFSVQAKKKLNTPGVAKKDVIVNAILIMIFGIEPFGLIAGILMLAAPSTAYDRF